MCPGKAGGGATGGSGGFNVRGSGAPTCGAGCGIIIDAHVDWAKWGQGIRWIRPRSMVA